MKKVKLTFRYLLPPGMRGREILPDESDELYPLIPIRLYSNEVKSPPFEGLLDSGAHGLFIPRKIADALKLSLGKPVQSTGVDGPYDAFSTKVGLIIGRGGSQREYDFDMIDAIVPKDDKDVPVLVGRHPVFDEYQIVFEQYKRKFHLIPKKEK